MVSGFPKTFQILFESAFGGQLLATQGDSLAANINRFLTTTGCQAVPLSCVFLSQLVVQSQPNLALNGDYTLNLVSGYRDPRK